jgi:hypothetical protein
MSTYFIPARSKYFPKHPISKRLYFTHFFQNKKPRLTRIPAEISYLQPHNYRKPRQIYVSC